MTFWGNVANIVARPNLDPRFVNLMSEVSRPGVKSILPLEGAVLAGRSTAEARRSGWLGFQERFVEEIVVAAVWLFGVKTIKAMFDKVRRGALPGTGHMDIAVDWSALKQKSVDLNPIERYTKNFAEGRKLLGIKGVTLGFSVVVTLAILGIVIPWLNQLKTKWIIERFFPHHKPDHKPNHKPEPLPHKAVAQPTHAPAPVRRPAESPSTRFEPITVSNPVRETLAKPPVNPPVIPGNGTPASPGRMPQAFPPAPLAWQPIPPLSPMPFPVPGMFGVQQPQITMPMIAWNPAYNPVFPQTYHPAMPVVSQQAAYQAPSQTPFSPVPPIRFGKGAGSTVLENVARVGHWIQNTDYGEILVTDVGITSGRCVVASRRSPFESLEIFFRDGASLYFYVMCVPHLTGLLNKVLNPALKASILLDPMAAEKLSSRLQKAALSEMNRSGGQLSLAQVKQIVEGITHPEIPALQKALASEIRQANVTQDFLPLLQKEAKVLAGSIEQGQALSDMVAQDLVQRLSGRGQVHADEIASLIQEIESGKGRFQSLVSAQERSDLVRAVKQAFRHTVGMGEKPFLSVDALKRYLESLPEAEATALKSRIRTMAKQDGMDLVNSMFRRSLIVARTELGNDHKLITQAELLSEWIEKSATRLVPFETVVQEEIEAIQAALGGKLPTLTSAQKQAVEKTREILAGKLPYNPECLTLVQEALSQSGKESFQQISRKLEVLSPVFLKGKGLDFTSPVRRMVTQLSDSLKSSGTGKALLAHYQADMNALMENQGRLFALHVGEAPASLGQKLTALLNGGLKHDQAFLREALHITGNLTENAREYARPEKVHQMQHAISDYLKTFLKYAESHGASVGAESKPWTAQTFETLSNQFFKLSRNTRIGVQFIAIPSAMVGLGLLVPKLQFLLTRVLTGKNQHPGIAAVSHGALEGHDGVPAPDSLFVGPSLNRNNFQAFRHA